MSKRLVRRFATIMLLVVVPQAKATFIVYNNTTLGFDTGISFTALQQGDQVSLAGTARKVTELLIGVTRQGFPGSADMQVRMFENDGLGGQPGTLLWDSGLFDDVPLVGDPELLSFAVPKILVPDTFTWTIQFSDSQGPAMAAVGLTEGFVPTVGTFVTSWFGSGGMTDVVHVSQVKAIPEPTTLALLGLGLAGLGFARRRLH